MRALRSLAMARHRLFMAFFACALALRLAVPAGWMPVAQADGVVRLALCPAAALITAAHGPHASHAAAHKHDPASHDHDRGDHAPPCAFAGLALAAALPDLAPAPRLIPTVAPPAALRDALVAVGHGLAAPPPPQTGPPLLA